MVLCLLSVVNAHVEIIIPRGGGGGGAARKVLPARALRVQATHFRGQGKLSNQQSGPSSPPLALKDYIVLFYSAAPL